MFVSPNSQINIQATRVRLIRVLCINKLANRFCHIFRMSRHFGGRPIAERLNLCRVMLRRCDIAVFEHPVDNILLPNCCTPWIDNRIICRGCLRKSGQHRSLSDRNFFQRFAKIYFASRRKSIRALPQIDLVHVDLKNLLLGHLALYIQSKSNFVNLTNKGFFCGKVEVACNLHGYGRGTLTTRLA